MKVFLVYRVESSFDYYTRCHTEVETLETIFTYKHKATTYIEERLSEKKDSKPYPRYRIEGRDAI